MTSRTLEGLSDDLRNEVEQCIDRFEEAWKRGAQPDLAQFLPQNDEIRLAALCEVVQIDLEYRYKAGEQPDGSDYFVRFPELQSAAEFADSLNGAISRLKSAAQSLSPSVFASRNSLDESQGTLGSAKATDVKEGQRQEKAGSLPDMGESILTSIGTPAVQSNTNGQPNASTKSPSLGTNAPESLLTVIHAGMQSAPLAETAAVSSRVPTDIDFVAGSTLGPYEIIAKLGEGGMGAVYKARHKHLDKIVALKLLRRHLIQSEEITSRFKREMKAVGQVEHPNIVRAMDAGEIEGSLYLAMEYVDGTDLQHLMKQNGPMAVGPACNLLRQAALALAAAHQAGLVHRDLKPGNLLLSKTGQIKVLDLGLARLAADQHNTELTSAGQTFGTPDYMPPEQWDDAHSVDHRADLYALGCTLFYLLVGQPPYSTGKNQSMTAKMRGHMFDKIPNLRTACRTEVPDGVVQIYEQLLAKNPNDRMQSAEILAQALAPFTTDGSVTAGDGVVSVRESKSSNRRTLARTSWLTGSAFFLLASLILIWQPFPPRPPLWLPAKLQQSGFKASSVSHRCQIGGTTFETQLVRTIAGKEVNFLLVPEFEIPQKQRKIRSFYIMETVVSNAMFNAFANDRPKFEVVDREESQRTWKSGDDQPVVNVHPLEAQQFAQWLDGEFASMPTTTEWDLASGYYDFVGLLKAQAKTELTLDLVMSGQNNDTGTRFKVGVGPGIGEFQATGKKDALNHRSPYGCAYPSRELNNLIAFGEMTATVRDVKLGVDDMREWMSEISKVNMDEILSTASSQLRMLAKRDKDVLWIITDENEKAGRLLTVEELDELGGFFLLNPSYGGTCFDRNTGFRVILQTKTLEEPEKH